MDNSYATVNFSGIEGTWFPRFMRLLKDDCIKDDMGKIFDSVSFITFNYDRCIEHYLYHALQPAFTITGEEAASLMEKLVVFHPYGKIANLPWESYDNRVPYGVHDSGNLLSFAANIEPSRSA